MRDLSLVLHGIAIKKYGTAEQVADITGLEPDRVETLLAEAVEKGRVSEAKGKYMLTPAAQITLKGEYAKAYGDLREDADFMAAYEEFERINVEFKQLITQWQTMEVGGQTVANDHSDPDYDADIIDRLGEVHERVERVLDRLAAKEPRMTRYKEKLLEALEKSEDGDHKWVSDATIDSYHTVWFELHEDLLRVVGREREE
ncbi:hypothetical protein PC39_12341 [Salinisphaera sp. PC39]|uniref:hypothetical protein n=1 Tax=Salinisphaera sp. PC39 TaxID=1304156 RepID=UPI0033423E54